MAGSSRRETHLASTRPTHRGQEEDESLEGDRKRKSLYDNLLYVQITLFHSYGAASLVIASGRLQPAIK